MPSYIEEDTSSIIPGTNIIKPILYTTYKTVTKYDITVNYEDSTSKKVELVQKDKSRLYKFIYKKEGKLLSIIGIPTVYEINENSHFTDYANEIMDSNDLLFEVDSSEKYESKKARFYLKDIRDIIDLSVEGFPDPEDPMEIFPITQYPIYLNNHSCESICKITVDDSLTTVLNFEITKMGDPLQTDQYSDFTILSVSDSDIIYESTEINKLTMYLTEATLGKEIKIIVKYFVKEINHPVFDEFTVIFNKYTPDEDIVDEDINKRAVSTQDAQYLGDGLKTGLSDSMTPGFKPYQYRRSYINKNKK